MAQRYCIIAQQNSPTNQVVKIAPAWKLALSGIKKKQKKNLQHSGTVTVTAIYSIFRCSPLRPSFWSGAHLLLNHAKSVPKCERTGQSTSLIVTKRTYKRTLQGN